MNPDKTVPMFFSFFRFPLRFSFAAKGSRSDCFSFYLFYTAINLDVTGNRASISMDEPGFVPFWKISNHFSGSFDQWGRSYLNAEVLMRPLDSPPFLEAFRNAFFHIASVMIFRLLICFRKAFQKTYLLTLSCWLSVFLYLFFPDCIFIIAGALSYVNTFFKDFIFLLLNYCKLNFLLT